MSCVAEEFGFREYLLFLSVINLKVGLVGCSVQNMGQLMSPGAIPLPVQHMQLHSDPTASQSLVLSPFYHPYSC